MSTALFISLDRTVPGFDPNARGRVFLSWLVGDHESMGALCRRLGVPSLSSFQSYDPKGLAQFIDDPAKLAAAMAKARPVEWFDPAAALPAVRAVREHYGVARFVRPRGRRVGGKWQDVDRTDDLLAELDDTAAVLLTAAEHGVRFRFHIG